MTGTCPCCHTDRPIKSRGLCQSCYSRNQKRGALDQYPSPLATGATERAKRARDARAAARTTTTNDRIEQALARYGTVLGAMTATGAEYEQVQAVKRRMAKINAQPDLALARTVVRDRAKVAA